MFDLAQELISKPVVTKRDQTNAKAARRVLAAAQRQSSWMRRLLAAARPARCELGALPQLRQALMLGRLSGGCCGSGASKRSFALLSPGLRSG